MCRLGQSIKLKLTANYKQIAFFEPPSYLRVSSDHNRKADVLIVKNNSKVNAFKVPSKTDKYKILRKRNEEAIKKPPRPMQGKVEVLKKQRKLNETKRHS